ncbi:MAG: tetratricopeptide repeat protein, partial [Holophagales bacterium]|nr:tetratricopeptide repeat protein [Holophagales bacterium]
PLLERALTSHLEHHGAGSLEVAATRDLLGQLLDAVGEPDRAAEHLELALERRRQQRPRDDVALTAVLNNLALTRKHQGRQAEAEALARENLDLRREIWGGDHLEVAVALNNLGYILLRTEGADPEEVRELLSRGLELRRRHLGDSHPDVAVSFNNLGSLLLIEGDHKAAKPHLEQALEIWRRFLGEHHPDVLACQLNLITLLQRSGDGEAALERLELLLPRIEEHLGSDSPIAAAARLRLSQLTAEPGG